MTNEPCRVGQRGLIYNTAKLKYVDRSDNKTQEVACRLMFATCYLQSLTETQLGKHAPNNMASIQSNFKQRCTLVWTKAKRINWYNVQLLLTGGKATNTSASRLFTHRGEESLNVNSVLISTTAYITILLATLRSWRSVYLLTVGVLDTGVHCLWSRHSNTLLTLTAGWQ